MSTTMRADVWEGPHDIQERQVNVPATKDGWTLVKVAYNGICGTDLAIWKGLHPRAKAPLVPGHEISGWSASPEDPRRGDIVVVEPLIECGHCGPCLHGYGYVCDNLGLYGIDAPGGMAEYVSVPSDTVHYLPSSTPMLRAALVEPLAVAVHAVRLSHISEGDTVAIFGAGPIGVLTAVVAKARGAGHISITEPNEWRAQHAAKFGFSVFRDAQEMFKDSAAHNDGQLADIVFDAAAHPSVSPILTDAVRVKGQIVIVGVYKNPSLLNFQAICFKELEMAGVRVYSPEDFREAVKLIADNTLDLDEFTTSVFDLAQVDAAFDAAASGEGQFKVLLAPGNTDEG